MIDAATIGITLALNNGVSDGIAQIRRELAALDSVVAASSAGLAALAAQAFGLAVPARATAALRLPLPRQVPAAPGREAAPDAPLLLLAPRAPAEAPVAAVQQEAPFAPAAPVPHAVVPLPDYAPFGRTLAAMPGIESGPTVPASLPPAAPAPREERNARAWPSFMAPFVSVAPVAAVPSMPEWRATAAPVAAPPSPPVVNAVAAPASSPGDDATRPAPAGMAEGPVEITLDGAVLARWIGHELTAQATRPPSGATGFDPRQSPPWTGV